MHGKIGNAMKSRSPQMDQGLSALIEDLKQRGQFDDTLLVITGEFGRTPKINSKAGRDHWGSLSPLVLAGGGLNMGQVIGQSDKIGGSPLSDPISTAALTATILHTLVDPAIVRLQPQVPEPIQQALSRSAPIPGL